MNPVLSFFDREKFRAWLRDNYLSKEGIWIKFSKTNLEQCIKVNEALEKALCFGWIDGQLKRIDERAIT